MLTPADPPLGDIRSHRVYALQHDANTIDVVVARSGVVYPRPSLRGDISFTIPAAGNFPFTLAAANDYGFARLRNTGGQWLIDADYRVNLDGLTNRVTVTIDGPRSVISGRTETWCATATGGVPFTGQQGQSYYAHTWERYDRPCNGGGGGSCTGGICTDGGGMETQGGPDDPPCGWVSAGTTRCITDLLSGLGDVTFRVTSRDSQGRSATAEALVDITGGSALQMAPDSAVSAEATATLSGDALPEAFGLEQNQPNPFNPLTEIRYALPVDTPVRLAVYDVTGREVARLVDGQCPAGFHRATWDGSRMGAGVYFYRVEAGSFIATRRMVLSR